MSDQIIDLNARRPGNSGSASRPASPAQAAALLTACLALVRPVGMGDDEAEEWLGAAVSALGTVRIGALDRACLEARRTCTHHSQIVPTIAAVIDADSAERARIAEWTRPAPPALPAPRIAQSLFEEIVAERGYRLSVHLDRGLVISNGDGTFRLPSTAA